MAFCSKCGADMGDGRFCPNCGFRIAESNSTRLCEECGKPYPVGSYMCPHCGSPIEHIAPVRAASSRKRKESSLGKQILIVALLVILTIGLGVGAYIGIQYNNAQTAIKQELASADTLFSSGSYSNALDIFSKYPDNEHAVTMVDHCYYHLGRNATNSGFYEQAKDCFSQIKTVQFEDVDDLIKECDEGIRRSNCADENFLRDLESTVKIRLQAGLNMIGEKTLTAEVNKLEPYLDAEFYDPALKRIARIIIGESRWQLKAYDEERIYLQQLTWYTHEAIYTAQLNEMYSQYDFMKNNDSFVEEYINNAEKHKNYIVILREIMNDILDSLDRTSSWSPVNNYQGYKTLTNNSDYTLGILFHYNLYTHNDQFVTTDTYNLEYIPPHSDYLIYVDVPYRFDGLIYTDWEVLSVK